MAPILLVIGNMKNCPKATVQRPKQHPWPETTEVEIMKLFILIMTQRKFSIFVPTI